MSDLLKRRNNIQIFKRLFAKKNPAQTQGTHSRLTGILKKSPMYDQGVSERVRKLAKKICGAFLAFGIVEYFQLLPAVLRGYESIEGVLENLEEGGGNKITEKYRHHMKERERKKSIGTAVGSGLAWFYYASYLQCVLADIKENPEVDRLPTKLYILIPRKCCVDLQRLDDNIRYEKKIRIGGKNVHLYSIMDGKTKYHCLCDCPNVLETINHVNNIKMAGIARSKYTYFDLPWNRNSMIQLFTNETKLVQLMRFYYALSSFLCLEIDKKSVQEKARLVLLNESEKKPSEVLLQAIKEDLEFEKNTKSEQNKVTGKDAGKQESEQKPSEVLLQAIKEYLEFEKNTKSEQNKVTGKDAGKQESEKKPSEVLLQAIKEYLEFEQNTKSEQNKVIGKDAGTQELDGKDPDKDLTDGSSEKEKKGSLMENKLLSAEEMKDVFYQYDVFVTHRRELDKNERKDDTEYKEDVSKINKMLTTNNMKVLLEENCLGKDWLTKLKYAATKCRWIVFLDTNDPKSNLFTSHKLTNALHPILESNRVQTVAIVNKRKNVFILDDLRWVTCIQNQQDKTQLADTVYNIVSGLDVKLKKSSDVYFQPGELAVGLAWDYASNHISSFVTDMPDQWKKLKDENDIHRELPYMLKLFISVPKTCSQPEIKSVTKADIDNKQSTYMPTKQLPFKPTYMDIYDDGLDPGSKKASKGFKYLMTLVGEYSKQIDVLRQMKEKGLLSDEEMNLEVNIFCKTVDRITELLIPERTNLYEFIPFDDTDPNITFSEAAWYRQSHRNLLLKYERLAPILSPF